MIVRQIQRYFFAHDCAHFSPFCPLQHILGIFLLKGVDHWMTRAETEACSHKIQVDEQNGRFYFDEKPETLLCEV